MDRAIYQVNVEMDHYLSNAKMTLVDSQIIAAIKRILSEANVKVLSIETSGITDIGEENQ